MSELDKFMAEIKAYDYKWFCEIGGQEALAEIGRLREQAHAQQSVQPTAFGAGGRGQNSLQSSFIADESSAKNGGG